MEEIIGRISGFMVLGSMLPYFYRVYQRKITPNLVSWIIWSFLSIAILLTYKSSGAKSNVWPAIFGSLNPLIITILSLVRNKKIEKPNPLEITCFFAALVSITFWFFVKNNKEICQYANYIALTADACAAIPTIIYYFKSPWADRPFCWIMYAIGYGLSVFAVTEPTFANYVLLIYMFTGSTFISMPLLVYRIKNKSPLKDYI